MIIRSGATRHVFLIKNIAIKIPRMTHWKMFLYGLLGNIQEKEFYILSDKLCPIIFSLPLGILIIMPRCKELSDDDFNNLNFDKFIDNNTFTLPVEFKKTSFGWLKNKIVAVDYGS